MRQMRWYHKLLLAAGGIFLAVIVVSAVVGAFVGFVIGLLLKLAIAAVVVGAIVVAAKVALNKARSGRQVSGKRSERAVREPEDYEYRRRPLPRADVEPVSYSPPPTTRPSTQDVDDELARLKREMGR
jgi:hypothetical protein